MRERERRADSRTTRSVSTGRYWVKVFFPPPRRHRRPSRSLVRSFARSPSGVLGDEFRPGGHRLSRTLRRRGRPDARRDASSRDALATFCLPLRPRVSCSSTRFNRRRVVVVINDESPHRCVTANRVPVYFEFSPIRIPYYFPRHMFHPLVAPVYRRFIRLCARWGLPDSTRYRSQLYT